MMKPVYKSWCIGIKWKCVLRCSHPFTEWHGLSRQLIAPVRSTCMTDVNMATACAGKMGKCVNILGLCGIRTLRLVQPHRQLTALSVGPRLLNDIQYCRQNRSRHYGTGQFHFNASKKQHVLYGCLAAAGAIGLHVWFYFVPWPHGINLLL